MVNGALAGYAIVAYIGLGNSIVDVWTNVVSWLRKPQRPAAERRRRLRATGPVTASVEQPRHWSETLAYAPADGVRRAERRRSSRRDAIDDERPATPGATRPVPVGGGAILLSDRRPEPLADGSATGADAARGLVGELGPREGLLEQEQV
jgi:hypothetical protein